jgi:hypothetical protein
MDKIIIEGRVIELDEQVASQALENLEKAPEGSVLVAISNNGIVLVRWIDEDSSKNIIPIIKNKDQQKNKPTKKLCPWLFSEVENQFDQVANEQFLSLETIHANYNENLEQRGKRPESFRRWVSKIRKRWVKMVIMNGKRTSDLESLVTY